MFSKTNNHDESTEKEVAAEPAISETTDSRPEEHQVRSCSYIGPTLHIKGELDIDESMSIEGKIEGTIKSKGKQLTVGKQGRVKADIHANVVEVRGKVEGHVYSDELVHLYSTAGVDGTIHSGRVVMDDGAVLNGSLDMAKEEAKPGKGKLTLASISENVPKIGS